MTFEEWNTTAQSIFTAKLSTRGSDYGCRDIYILPSGTLVEVDFYSPHNVFKPTKVYVSLDVGIFYTSNLASECMALGGTIEELPYQEGVEYGCPTWECEGGSDEALRKAFEFDTKYKTEYPLYLDL
jgi:hypothetical protein